MARTSLKQVEEKIKDSKTLQKQEVENLDLIKVVPNYVPDSVRKKKTRKRIGSMVMISIMIL